MDKNCLSIGQNCKLSALLFVIEQTLLKPDWLTVSALHHTTLSRGAGREKAVNIVPAHIWNCLASMFQLVSNKFLNNICLKLVDEPILFVKYFSNKLSRSYATHLPEADRQYKCTEEEEGARKYNMQLAAVSSH